MPRLADRSEPFLEVGDSTSSTTRLVDVMWAHLGNNFVLDFHEDALATAASFEISTGVGRSFNASNFIRPTNAFDVVSSYSCRDDGRRPSLKFGYRGQRHSTG